MAQDGQKCSRLVKIGGFYLNKVYILLVLMSVTEMLTQFITPTVQPPKCEDNNLLHVSALLECRHQAVLA